MKKTKTAELERLARIEALLRAAAARDRRDARLVVEGRETWKKRAKW